MGINDDNLGLSYTLVVQISQGCPTKRHDSNKVWWTKVSEGNLTLLRGGRLAAGLQLCTLTFSSSCLHSLVTTRPAIVSTQLIF